MSSKLLQGFRLGPWQVEPLRGVISGPNGEAHHLEPKVMDVFVCLADRANELVTRNQLLDVAWSGNTAFDEQLTRAIGELRRALQDDRGDPEYIETVPKRGYRLICPVVPVEEDLGPPGLSNSRRFFALAAGIAALVIVTMLTFSPKLWDLLLPVHDSPRERSVAVLPFIDMSEDGSQQYLSDGVSEELIHVLSNLPDMQVTARTSSFAFRDSNEDIRQIGSKLNVATILEGSIRKDGDRIRVTAQLADTRNGYHLWSHTFDRHTSDLFRVQNEIAVAVAKTFEYRELDALATDDRVARVDELQAYDFYLLGLHQLRKNIPSSRMLAIQHFERAIEMNPSFARAYAGLSRSYASRYFDEMDQELADKAESAAEYALLLDDQSAETFVAVGVTKLIKGDYSGGETAIIRAIELNPNDAGAYSWLTTAYERQGKEDEAFAVLQKALALDPMSGRLNFWMGHMQYMLPGGDIDTALKYWIRAIERDPDYHSSYSAVGHYYWYTGQLDRAIPYFKKVADLTTGPTGVLIGVYIDIGDYESAANTIRRMREYKSDRFQVPNMEIQLQLALGDVPAARDIVHSMLPKYIDNDSATGLMAFYEVVIGDTNHAEEIYARLAAAPEPPGFLIFDENMHAQANLYRSGTLRWGMLGAVNLAYLHTRNGDSRAARELLVKARAYIESRSDVSRFVSGSLYILAQIAAVEGNNDAAIEYIREAVEAGWSRAWFGRIDPIMADLRTDARYMQILEELEEKLSEMREHPITLASTEP